MGIRHDGINGAFSLAEGDVLSGTIAFWVTRNGDQPLNFVGYINSMEGAGGSDGYALLGGTGPEINKVLFFIDNVELLKSSNNLPDGVRTHIIITWDNSSSELYVNNNLDDAGAGGIPTHAGGANKFVGRYLSRFFNGDINELGIWNGVKLTAPERIEVFESGIKGRPTDVQGSNLAVYYSYDDGEVGTSANGDTARDKSGNNRDSVGAGGVSWLAEDFLSYPGSVINIIVEDVALARLSAMTKNIWFNQTQQYGIGAN